eukprot:4150673-Amphidinium_carterae.1
MTLFASNLFKPLLQIAWRRSWINTRRKWFELAQVSQVGLIEGSTPGGFEYSSKFKLVCFTKIETSLSLGSSCFKNAGRRSKN